MSIKLLQVPAAGSLAGVQPEASGMSMPNLLESDAFPFETREGAEFVRAMESVFPSASEALSFAGQFKIRTGDLRTGTDIRLLWRQLVRRLALKGKLRNAVEITLATTARSDSHEFLRNVLGGHALVLDAQPVSFGAPSEYEYVSEKEAYLFYDDLTIGIPEIEGLIATLSSLAQRAKSVCHITVERGFQKLNGTGFKVGTNTVLTNHHVLFPDGQRATKVVVKFGFDHEAGEPGDKIGAFTGNLSSVIGEENSDWAAIDLNEDSSSWPTINLADIARAKINDRAFIVQHPKGNHKRLGYVRNKVSEIQGIFVRYLTDTTQGSSGAPVFDERGRIIALHHAGGRPVEVAGKPPIVKNEGICIAHVLDRLARLKQGSIASNKGPAE